MKRLPLWITANPVLPWGLLFIALNLLVTQYGGLNAMTRVAAMRAITEGHTLAIDNYKEWTSDWAHSPNGHYYSNKAPGAALLGLPFFAVTEVFSLPLGQKKLDAKGRVPEPGYLPHLTVMLAIQILPFFLLVLYISAQLLAAGTNPLAVHFFAFACFFGNTAALYMNSNFGHGVSAVLFLAAAYAWYVRRYGWLGVFLSWALLCDYGVAFALPFFLLATLWRERNLRSLLEIALGAMPGAAVWIWYHTVAFGSPFTTANQFTNPTQIETLPGTRVRLWGEYSPFPEPWVLRELLFGPSRGILFTQPWMLAVFALPFLRGREQAKGLALLTIGSLAGLLWMNGGFGGWHGGWGLGPRYLSVVFPAMAFALAVSWERFPRAGRPLLLAGLAVALLFRAFTFPFPSLAPNENLWAWHWHLLTEGGHTGTTVLRYALEILAVAGAVWLWRRQKAVSISRDSV